jgi:hypothetical protein
MRAAAVAISRPASVDLIPFGVRSTSGIPAIISSWRICTVTAGGVMCRASAAAAKLPARRAVVKVRSWRRVTWRISH